MIIRDCKNILVDHLIIDMIYDHQFKFYSLLVVNALGESHSGHILCHNIQLHFSATEIETESSILVIDDYHTQNELLLAYYNIMLTMDQFSYRVMVQLSNTSVAYYINSFISVKCSGITNAFILNIINCQFKFNYFELFNGEVNGFVNDVIVYFKNYQFLKNYYSTFLIIIHSLKINMINCFFS